MFILLVLEESPLKRRGILLYFIADGTRALVIGSGTVGRRKIYKLLEAGMDVTVVTKEEEKKFGNKVKVVVGDGLQYVMNNIDRFEIIVAATDDVQLNATISNIAKRRGKLVNSVTSKENCNIFFPAVLDYESFQVGITTGGDEPRLSKQLKKLIKKALGPNGL